MGQRPLRRQAGLDGSAGPVHGRLDPVERGVEHRRPDRLPCAPGRRRRPHAAHPAEPIGRGGRRTQARTDDVADQSPHAVRANRGTSRRRPDRQPPVVAVDLLGQRAVLPGRPRPGVARPQTQYPAKGNVPRRHRPGPALARPRRDPLRGHRGRPQGRLRPRHSHRAPRRRHRPARRLRVPRTAHPPPAARGPATVQGALLHGLDGVHVLVRLRGSTGRFCYFRSTTSRYAAKARSTPACCWHPRASGCCSPGARPARSPTASAPARS